MAQENKLVTEFQKSDIEIVRVSLTQYKNKDYFDIRLHYRDDGGEWKPTRKGLCLGVGLLPELTNAIKTLDKVIKHGEHRPQN